MLELQLMEWLCHPGISGIPGSGKSSAAYPLVDRMNELANQEIALCIGGDGWHYSQAQLRAMEVSVRHQGTGYRLPTDNSTQNSSHLFARRGAHFTFDADAFAAFVANLRDDRKTEDIHFPTFSHSHKDPVEGDGCVGQRHQIM
jgi:pantothenate kinase